MSLQDTDQRRAGAPADFSDGARAMHAQRDVASTLRAVTQLARTMVGAEYAAITMVRGPHFVTVGATSDVPMQIDELQYQTNEGPCVDAIREKETFYSPDLAEESRWPHFAGRVAAATGVHSMLAHRLYLEGDTLGALNLYDRRVGAFTPHDSAMLVVFAAHAAVAIDAQNAQLRADQLQSALASNRMVGVAAGILMMRDSLALEVAVETMKTCSQNLNRKLVDVAREVVETRELPHA